MPCKVIQSENKQLCAINIWGEAVAKHNSTPLHSTTDNNGLVSYLSSLKLIIINSNFWQCVCDKWINKLIIKSAFLHKLIRTLEQVNSIVVANPTHLHVVVPIQFPCPCVNLLSSILAQVMPR